MANRRSLANRRNDKSAPLRPYSLEVNPLEAEEVEPLVFHDVAEARQLRRARPVRPLIVAPPPLVVTPAKMIPTSNRRSLANRRNDANAPLRPYFGYVPPVDGGSTEVCDDFQRADGAIGPDWLLGQGPQWVYGNVAPFIIEDGAAVASIINDESGPPTRYENTMVWHQPQGADQSIEVEVEGVWNGDGYVQLFTNANATDLACQFVDFQFGSLTSISVSIYPFDAEGNWESGNTGDYVTVPHAPVDPVRLRFESDADGTQRVYVDGSLVLTWVDDDPVTGPYVGMALEPNVAPSPRILEACMSTTGG